MSISLPPLTLIIGGAASGKSHYAELLLEATERTCLYIATASAYDDEMRRKIERHQQRRGDVWRTIEAPLDLHKSLAAVEISDVVLIDCATMWLTNHLMAAHVIADGTHQLLTALASCKAPVVTVTNDLGGGIVPENALARKFRQAQGELNQQLAAQADLVVNVIAGLPMTLKGDLPDLSQ